MGFTGVGMTQNMVVRMLLASGVFLIFSQLATGQTATKAKTSADSALPIAVSGHEERLAAAIRERVRALGPKTDNLGNVHITIGKEHRTN